MRVLMPLPNSDFDPSEAAITWSVLTQAEIELVFATKDGKVAAADALMLSGEGFDFWAWVPPLAKFKLIGLFLRANARARDAYKKMQQSDAFQNPLSYKLLQANEYDGLVIPGGHAPGMREYLENPVLQNLIGDFFAQNKSVGAICHGALLIARSQDKQTKRSVLYGRKTTSLTWALEKKAWRITRYFGRFWDRDYYRTYRETREEAEGYWSVESEIKRLLKNPEDYCDVTRRSLHYFRQASGLFRDTENDTRCAFVVVDGNYVSARWPGDAHSFARQFLQVLKNVESNKKSQIESLRIFDANLEG